MHDNEETAHRYGLGKENDEYLWFFKFPPRGEDERLAPLLYVSNSQPTQSGIHTGRALPFTIFGAGAIYTYLPNIYEVEDLDEFHSRMKNTAGLEQTLEKLAPRKLQKETINKAPILTNLELNEFNSR